MKLLIFISIILINMTVTANTANGTPQEKWLLKQLELHHIIKGISYKKTDLILVKKYFCK